MDLIKSALDFRSFLLNTLATKFHYVIIVGIICGIAFTVIVQRPVLP